MISYKVIDILFLFLVTGGGSTLLGNLGVNSISSIPNYIMILLYIIMILRLLKINIKSNKVAILFIFIFITFIVTTIFASQNFNASIKAMFYMTCNILYAYYIYSKYSVEEVIMLFSYTLGFIAIINLILCILLPNQFTYFDNLYMKTVWKGIFPHKNTLGNMSAFTILIVYLNIKVNKSNIRRNLWIGIIFISILNLIFSNSHTPVYVLIVCIIYAIIKKMLKREIAPIFYITILALNYLYIFRYDLVYNSLHKYNLDLSISGRREIFDILLRLIKDRPFCGYGIGSVWVPDSFTYNRVYNYVGFNPNTSHNAFIEMSINIGVIGVLIYLLILTTTFIRSIRKYNENNKYTDLMIIMIFLLVMSSFESTLAIYVGIYWVMQFYIFLIMSSKIKS